MSERRARFRRQLIARVKVAYEGQRLAELLAAIKKARRFDHLRAIARKLRY